MEQYGAWANNHVAQMKPEAKGDWVRFTDAQATIAALEETILKMGENAAVVAKDAMAAKEQVAALQGQVRELEQWVQDQSTANLETMRHTDEMQSRALEAEQQLTQRTAELEAAKRERDVWYARYNELSGVKDRQLNDLQAELERVRAERDHAKKMEVVQKEVADNQTWHAQKLRTLIAANKETKHDAI